MKIARIETFLFDPGVAKNLLFVRVEMADGIYGWGEAYVSPGKETVIQKCVEAMAKYVIGRSCFSIRHTATALKRDRPQAYPPTSALPCTPPWMTGLLPVFHVCLATARAFPAR